MILRLITVVAVLAAVSLPVVSQAVRDESAAPGSFDQRLGPDDGAALAILFWANSRGNLETCDCNFPRGGLARRVGYAEAFSRKFKNTPVVQVEVGAFLSDGTDYQNRLSAAALLQNEKVVEAYNRWPPDVINLSRSDLLYAARLFARDDVAQRLAAWPVLRRIVSANVNLEGRTAPPPGYLIKTVRGPRFSTSGRKLRIGFVGIAEPMRMSEGRDAIVRDMIHESRLLVPKLRRECDLLVLLAHSEFEAAMRVARANPEADVVIVGNAEAVFKPRQEGRTFVVCAAPGNIQQGDLRIYMDKRGKFSFKFSSVDLDATVPANPAASDFVEAARVELNRSRNPGQMR